MSFLSAGKSKDKDNVVKKSQFYVEFLGWMECRGLRGERYTEPVIRELRRRHGDMKSPPKLTIQVSRSDLKITQEIEEKKKRGIKKIKFPTIPARDVTFVHQSVQPGNGRLDDIVACIYLGYMPRTQRYVHVHVYRFDEADTASLFVKQLSLIVAGNQDHIRDVELELATKGEVDDPRLIPREEFLETRATDSVVSSASRSQSDDGSATFGSDEIDSDLQSLTDIQPFDSVTNELKYRLQTRDAPLLLPPKDYDTISRAHGNLNDINKRRCLNTNITGANDLPRDNIGSQNDIDSLAVDNADTNIGNSTSKATIATLKVSENRNPPRESPALQHVPLPHKETKNSHQAPKRPTDFNEYTQSSNIFHRIDVTESVNSKFGSSESVQSGSGYVYSPKAAISPMSSKMFLPPQGPPFSRQGSHNSHNSEGSKLSSRSDENRAGSSIQYKFGPNDELYALPMKAFKQQEQPTDELPPDYQDDDDLLPPGMSQLHSQPYLTQSLPADMIRDKLKVGNNSRPNSAELRSTRQPASLMVSQQPSINGGMYFHKNAPK